MRLYICASTDCPELHFIPESFDCVLRNNEKIWVDTTGDVCFGKGVDAEVKGDLVLDEKTLTNKEIVTLLSNVKRIEKFYLSTSEENVLTDMSKIQFKDSVVIISASEQNFKFENFEIEVC